MGVGLLGMSCDAPPSPFVMALCTPCALCGPCSSVYRCNPRCTPECQPRSPHTVLYPSALWCMQVLPPDMMVLAEPSAEGLCTAIDEALLRLPSAQPMQQHARVRGPDGGWGGEGSGMYRSCPLQPCSSDGGWGRVIVLLQSFSNRLALTASKFPSAS